MAGNIFFCNDIIEKIDSTLPAAPRRCPIDDFVEDLQEQVNEFVGHLDGHDSQPLKMIVEDKFADFVQSLDDIV